MPTMLVGAINPTTGTAAPTATVIDGSVGFDRVGLPPTVTTPLAGLPGIAAFDKVGLVTITVATIPDPPSGVAATAGDGQVTISWVPPTDHGAGGIASYQVYIVDSATYAAGGAGAFLGATGTPIDYGAVDYGAGQFGGTVVGGTVPIFFTYTVSPVVWGGLTNGSTYYFAIKAVANSGLISVLSSVAFATPTGGGGGTGGTGGSGTGGNTGGTSNTGGGGGIGAPLLLVRPAPPPTTSISIGNWNGTQDVELTGITDRTLNVSLLDPSSISFKLLGDHSDSIALREGISDVLWRRNGVKLSLQRLCASDDALDETAYSISCKCEDYRALLDQRNLTADYAYGGVSIEDVAWNLINAAQGQVGGNLGITKGLWPLTGQVAAVGGVFKDGDTVYGSLKTLSTATPSFEFDIDADKKANLYYSQRGGIDNGAILDYGGVISNISRNVDLKTFANAIRQSGATGQQATNILASNMATRPEGRWDAAFSDTTLASVAAIASAGQFNFNTHSDILPSYTLSFKTNAWGGPSHVWLGDIVTVVARRGRLQVNGTKLRVFNLSIALDSNGNEKVQATVGRPKIDILKFIMRTLNTLNKQ